MRTQSRKRDLIQAAYIEEVEARFYQNLAETFSFRVEILYGDVCLGAVIALTALLLSLL